VVFMPFTTSFMSHNVGSFVPTQLYNLSLVVTGLLNIRLIRIVTSAPVVAESAPRDRIAYVRARGPGVVLGALIVGPLLEVLGTEAPLVPGELPGAVQALDRGRD